MNRSIVFKTRGMQIVEARIGESIEGALRRLYEADGRTQDEIAAVFGVDRGTVSRWMREYGIESRYLGPRKAA